MYLGHNYLLLPQTPPDSLPNPFMLPSIYPSILTPAPNLRHVHKSKHMPVNALPVPQVRTNVLHL